MVPKSFRGSGGPLNCSAWALAPVVPDRAPISADPRVGFGAGLRPSLGRGAHRRLACAMHELGVRGKGDAQLLLRGSMSTMTACRKARGCSGPHSESRRPRLLLDRRATGLVLPMRWRQARRRTTVERKLDGRELPRRGTDWCSPGSSDHSAGRQRLVRGGPCASRSPTPPHGPRRQQQGGPGRVRCQAARTAPSRQRQSIAAARPATR